MSEVSRSPREPSAKARYRGALLGLAAGDAIGTAVEFQAPGSFPPVTGMTGGGAFRLRPGEWTDDTSMALCLAESLIVRRGFDPIDQLERYLRWYREGYHSSTGVCFDIGNTTRDALERFAQTHEPYGGSSDPRMAGNGSLMRLAPVPLAYARNPREAIRLAAASSRTTHGAETAVDACRYLAALIVGALDGLPKDELLAPSYSPVPGLWQEAPLHPEVAVVAAGSFKEKDPPAIRGRGYAVASLEAALWAFDRSDTFRDGCLLAVNLGEDADTTAAVFGQLAGAYYGEGAIPAEWRERLAQRETIELFADDLFELAGELGRSGR
jgi:ADP-ribosylglycohydrolase